MRPTQPGGPPPAPAGAVPSDRGSRRTGGRGLFGLGDPAAGQPEGPAAVKRLQDLLAKVPPAVVSKAGKAELARRVPELQRFLSEVAAESQDDRAL